MWRAIISVGAVSAAGRGVDALWRALMHGRPLLHPRRDGVIAADVPHEVFVDAAREHRGLGRLPRVAQMSLLAVVEAIRVRVPVGADAPAPPPHPPETVGVVMGSAFASFAPIYAFCDDSAQVGPASVSPLLFPDTVMNAPAGHIAIHLGVRGPTATVSAGRISGSLALVEGVELLASTQADRVIVCGADDIPPAQVLAAMGDEVALETQAAPESPGSPLGAAAGALVITSDAEEDAEATLRSAVFVSRPEPRRAIAQALEEAKCAIDDLGGVVLSASTPGLRRRLQSDLAEVFGKVSTLIPCVEPAAFLGECFGGNGTIAAIVATRAARERILPPMPCRALPDVGGLMSPSTPEPLRTPIVMSLDVDSHGACAAIISAP